MLASTGAPSLSLAVEHGAHDQVFEQLGPVLVLGQPPPVRRCSRTPDQPAFSITWSASDMPQFGLAESHASVPRVRSRRSRVHDHMGQRDPEYVEAS